MLHWRRFNQNICSNKSWIIYVSSPIDDSGEQFRARGEEPLENWTALKITHYQTLKTNYVSFFFLAFPFTFPYVLRSPGLCHSTESLSHSLSQTGKARIYALKQPFLNEPGLLNIYVKRLMLTQSATLFKYFITKYLSFYHHGHSHLVTDNSSVFSYSASASIGMACILRVIRLGNPLN